MSSETTKLILNISKYIYMFLYSNLVYLFIIIYVQHFPKPPYIKYHKIIRALHRQLTSIL